MDTNTPRSGWDVFLFGIPLIALLVFGFFRLDEVFTARKGRTQDRRPASPAERKRKSMHSDPDGRSWDDPHPPQK
jgi:hypothetical protein